MSPKVDLYQHQRTMLGLMRANEGLALFAEMGTGKTLPTLMRALDVARRGGECLVVAPAAVCAGWLSKISDYFDPRDQETLRSHLTVTSYEMSARPGFSRHWDMLVLDEGHYIKSATAKRSKRARVMACDADLKYLLTGTPTSNGQLSNLWSELCFLDPRPGSREGLTLSNIWEPYTGRGGYYEWLNRFARLDQWHKPYGYRDVSTIQKIVGEHAYRITKAECLDLPEVLPDEILRVPDGETRLYRNIARESADVEHDILCENSLTRLLALRQICSGFVTQDGTVTGLKDPKATWLREFLKDFDGKLVVFCDFRHSVDVVADAMTKAHMNPIILDGRTTDKGCWELFQHMPDVRGIVCQYQSGGAGIDLTAASTCLFYEPTLSSNLNQQARDRIHRIGQGSACSYLYLMCAGSIEESIYKALRGYQDFSVSFFEQHMEECAKGEWK